MRSIFLLCALGATTAGCVRSPTTGTILQNQSDSIDFVGYASSPGAQLRIECKRPGTSSWTFMSNATARTNPTNPGEPNLLYRFDRSATVRSSCWSGGSIESTVVRVREPNASQVTQLYTFTSGGLSCAAGELVDGETWVTAGAVCNDGNEILLYANN